MNKRPIILGAFFIFSFLAQAATAADEDGKTKASTCFACHGENGNGNAANPLWPKLASQNPNYLIKQMKDFKQGPARTDPTMNGFIMTLADKDFVAVADYFSSLPVTHTVVEDQYFATGQKLYRAGDSERKVAACTACHGAKGEGLAAAGFPALAGQNAAYMIKQLKAFRSKTRDNDAGKVMRNVTKLMSDEQIEAVAHYVGGLH